MKRLLSSYQQKCSKFNLRRLWTGRIHLWHVQVHVKLFLLVGWGFPLPSLSLKLSMWLHFLHVHEKFARPTKGSRVF